MEEFVKTLLWMSLAGSTMSLVLFAAGRLGRKVIPQTVLYYLWLLVLLRMVLPLPGLLPVSQESSQPVVVVAVSEQQASQLVPSRENRAAGAEEVIRQSPKVSLWEAATAVWLVGFLLSLGRKAISYFRFRREVKRCSAPAGEMERKILDTLSGGRKPALFRCTAIHTPMLLGIIRPVLLLPAQIDEDQTLAWIFRHELTHFRRQDILYKWFAAVVLAIHWFNPLTIWMGRELAMRCEGSCDEQVVKGLGQEERKTYGKTLIALAGQEMAREVPLTTGMSLGKKQLKNRLLGILNQRRNAAVALVLTLLLMIALCGCGVILGPGETSLSTDTLFGESILPEEWEDLTDEDYTAYLQQAYGLSDLLDHRVFYQDGVFQVDFQFQPETSDWQLDSATQFAYDKFYQRETARYTAFAYDVWLSDHREEETKTVIYRIFQEDRFVELGSFPYGELETVSQRELSRLRKLLAQSNAGHPQVTAQEISQEEYADALEAYNRNPVMNGREKEITMEDSEGTSYYRVTIQDEGYSEELPVNVEVYLTTGADGRFQWETYFTVTEPKDLNASELRYGSILVHAAEYGTEGNLVYLSVVLSSVYNREGTWDYTYSTNVAVDLGQLTLARAK